MLADEYWRFRGDNRGPSDDADSTYFINIGTKLGVTSLGGYTLVTLPRIVTPYRDNVDEIRNRVTYQKLVTR
jgi:hypothetical protein